MSFDDAWKKTIGHEGGYSNDPNDTGGETMHGITARVARANGYKGDMRALPLVTAREIGRKQYWDTLRLDDVCALSPLIADEMFDTGYNAGIAMSGKFLQRALNALNRQGADFADIEADGVIGNVTISALREYMKRRGGAGETVLLRALNAQQGTYYMEIAANRPQNEAFVFGWFLNRVSL